MVGSLIAVQVEVRVRPHCEPQAWGNRSLNAAVSPFLAESDSSSPFYFSEMAFLTSSLTDSGVDSLSVKILKCRTSPVEVS